MMGPGTHHEARLALLGVSHWARNAAGAWENRYISAHLTEVKLYAEQALVQLEYARLAEEDPQRGASKKCWICDEDYASCHCAE